MAISPLIDSLLDRLCKRNARFARPSKNNSWASSANPPPQLRDRRTGGKKKIDFNDGISRIEIMSFAEVIEQLPRFTVVERQELLRNVLELDDEGLSDSELALVDQRLAAYQADPARAVAAETMAERIRTRFSL